MHTTVFVIYTIGVTVMSLIPGDQANVADLDKLAHLLVYYIFAVFGYRALANKRYYSYLCLGIIVYGALLEFGQSYVPGRDMSGYDLLANALGVVLGAIVASRKRPQAPPP